MAIASSLVMSSSLTRRLEGKVALITGGASGIRASTAKIFAENGAKVAIVDIQDDLGQSLVDSVDPSKKNATYIHCDVTDEEQVRSAVDETVSTFGKLDIMFNNAAVIDAQNPRVWEVEKSAFERVMNTNVVGVFLGMKHAARVMVPQRGGAIISTASSVSGISGVCSHAYTCSKHAVVGLTKNMAVELGQHGVRVNCVSPGGIPTPTATQFLGLDAEKLAAWNSAQSSLKGATLTVEDVANAALYLASDEAKFVSGVNLFVDGGFAVMKSSANMFTQTTN